MSDGIYPDEWEVQDYLGKDSDKAKAERLDDVTKKCIEVLRAKPGTYVDSADWMAALILSLAKGTE